MKTTVVGSYPTPLWLRVISNRESLQDAMLAVVKTQELAGIDVVADGELYRWDVNHAETNGMIDYFVKPLQGVEAQLDHEQLRSWRSVDTTRFRAKPPGVVVGALASGTLDLWADYQLYRDLTKLPKKFTVTSPYMLARTLADDYYHNLDDLVMAIADVLKTQLMDIDADIIQIDEANLPGKPTDGALAARAINRVVEGISGTPAVHLCFGNYGGQTIQTGEYRLLVDFLNALQVDHVILEMARRPDDELSVLQDVERRIGLGLGVIDIKDNEVETPDEVARRIEHAARTLGSERIKYVHPDCGFWMLPRSVADRKMRALVTGRDRYLGNNY